MKKFLTALTILIALVLCTASYYERFLNKEFPWNLYFVKSDSMSPAVSISSLIVTKKQSIYKIGDVVTFFTSSGRSVSITHRIVDWDSDAKAFITKGDNNKTIDPWLINPEQVKGKVALVIPFAGGYIEFIRTPAGLFLGAVLPLGIAISLELADLQNELKRNPIRITNWKLLRRLRHAKKLIVE